MTEKKEKEVKYSVRVVSYADYLQEARNLLAKSETGQVAGTGDVWNLAHILLFNSNEVVPNGNVVKGGEQRFVVKA